MSAIAAAVARAFDPAAGLVEVHGLSKRFGAVRAVDDLSFTVQPGRVTGFLGPNGAGKTTTLRLLLGLATPNAGTATIGGIRYDARPRPAHHVGSALEASSFHPGRTARDHLRVYAPQVGVPDSRCDEVLAQVGLEEAAGRRVGGFSLGMRQRLALATTLLGDPQVLLLDEPANGLDPEGIRWLRQFLRYLAAQGRTVLVSSHMLSEVEQTVDDVVIIASGRLVHESSLEQLAALARPAVRVVSPDGAGLAALVSEQGWTPVTRFESPNVAVVFDVHPPTVGAAAFARGLQLYELSPAGTNLEQLFLQLTADPVEGQVAGEASLSANPPIPGAASTWQDPGLPAPGTGSIPPGPTPGPSDPGAPR
jgi:ABC-2 type transport system ATP-binding protein